jgi:SOS response associated peptidase (SRAP)
MDLDAKLTLSPSADQRDASLLAGTIRTDPQQRIRNGTLVFQPQRRRNLSGPRLRERRVGPRSFSAHSASPYFPRLLLRSLRWNKFFPPFGECADVIGEQQKRKSLPRIYNIPIPEQPDLPVSYDIAPSQDILAIRFNPATGERSLDQLRWGLIPHWAKDQKIAYRTINARAETVDKAPSYRQAFIKRRCLLSMEFVSLMVG